MSKIFISYRRTDQPIVRVMYDRLVKIFGDGNIYWDVESFYGGKDFRDEIERVLSSCDIALAMISQNWAGHQPGANSYRISEDGDFVRIEIESLLRRQDKSIPEQERVPLIPVLINNMTMEQLPDLPDSIAQFRHLNASAIHPEPHFISDLEILVRRIIKQYADPAEQEALLRKTDVVFEHVTAPSAPLTSDQQRAADEAEAEAKLARAHGQDQGR